MVYDLNHYKIVEKGRGAVRKKTIYIYIIHHMYLLSCNMSIFCQSS